MYGQDTNNANNSNNNGGMESVSLGKMDTPMGNNNPNPNPSDGVFGNNQIPNFNSVPTENNGMNQGPMPMGNPAPINPGTVNPTPVEQNQVNSNPVGGVMPGMGNQNVNPIPVESIPQNGNPSGGVNSTNNINQGNVGMDPVNNVNVNGFVEPPKKENIGEMPPKQKPEKKPMNKGLFVILILVLMAGVAFGVYYLLKVSKEKQVSVKLKENVVVPLGGPVSTNIDDYAIISGADKTNCSVITSNIDPKKAGEYEYTVNCNSKSYRGKVVVKDNVAPMLSLNVVYKDVNEKNNIDVKEFVNFCKDESECQTDFKDKNQLENLAENAANAVDIVAKDKFNNEVTARGVIYLVSSPVKVLLSCNGKEEQISDGKVTKVVSDKIAMANTDAGVTSLNVGRREYIYTFKNEEDYLAAVGNKAAVMSYDSVEGLAYYDDEAKTLRISTDLSKQTLDSEAGGAIPTEYSALKDYYTNKGYKCTLASN